MFGMLIRQMLTHGGDIWGIKYFWLIPDTLHVKTTCNAIINGEYDKRPPIPLTY